MQKPLLAFLVSILFICGCGPSNSLKNFYTSEDKTFFDLLDKLKKNPNDATLQSSVRTNYENILATKSRSISDIESQMGAGDKYKRMLTELQILQQIRETILKQPTATAVIPQPKDFTKEIQDAKYNGAKDYYAIGMDYLQGNTREDAQKAYSALSDAYDLYPTYLDVAKQLAIAKDLATIKVVVSKVDYYSNGWSYYGFDKDYLQWRMVSDLNAGSYPNTRFFSDLEAGNTNLKPDFIVDLRYSSFSLGNMRVDRQTIKRSKQIPDPTPQPRGADGKTPEQKYITVTATLTVTRQYANSRGVLQCRIYEVATNRNILYDNFSGQSNWVNQYGSYSGDQRALSQDDLNIINNRSQNAPDRYEIAKQIIDQSYNSLIIRIKNGVQFRY